MTQLALLRKQEPKQFGFMPAYWPQCEYRLHEESEVREGWDG